MTVSGTAKHRWALTWRVLLYLILVFSPLIVRDLTGGRYGSNFIAGTGLALGLTGFAILALQPLLSSRFKWLERPFGLDRLLRIHRITGISGTLLVVAHPVMLAAGRGNWDLLLGFDLPWPLMAAKFTLAVLVLFAAAAVLHSKVRIPFQLWFRGHSWLTPVILAGIFIHSYAVAVRYQPPGLRILWFVLLGIGSFSYLHLTVYGRLGGRLRPWRVKEVQRAGRGVWNITMSPPEGGEVFGYLPGQFLFVTLLRGRGLPREEHPFTVSSSPTHEGSISITPKESGDFTSTLGKTEAGDGAAIMAPFGRFSYLLKPEMPRIVMIAGGIGITPMMSMLRYMRDKGYRKPVMLIYACRTREDVTFREELEAMALSEGSPLLEIVIVLSKPDASWEGERGYVDREKLERLAGNVSNTAFFICGPPPMMGKVNAELLEMGADRRNIHMERFSL